MFHAIAQCPLGLEPVCADEITSLGLEVGETLQDEGVVSFVASLDDLFRANLNLRCSERLSITVGEFEVRRFDRLEELTAAILWNRWFDDRRRLLLRVTSRGSKLYHEGAIAERMHKAIQGQLGRPIEIARGDELDDPRSDVQLVIVRLEKNQCVIRLDSSGTRLHRRGYREQTAKAPLRETLAAAIIRACGWEVSQPLVDPFCGSGTFLIEAAEQALGLAAGRRRSFAMERWPFVDTTVLAGIRAAESEREMPPPPPIYGSDRDEGAIRASTGNARRAEVLQAIRLERQPASAVRRPGAASGWVITNPPYGKFFNDTATTEIYTSFGRTLHEELSGWDLGILSPEPAWLKGMGLDFEEGPWLNNGGQHVQLLYARID
jgi:putative N6-adenine-specific DNA methylase